VAGVQIGTAEKLLRGLPDQLASSAGCEEGWREKSVPEMLKNWGWAAEIAPTGSLKIEWTQSRAEGDAVAPASLAALAALAPLSGNGSIVFSLPADGQREPELFGVRVSGGKTEVKSGHKKVTYELDID
jgi:hypothetical protein